ncbi:MAG: bifunctional diaminohydroxyphosphoribosylaminopyrimidine deaminase/5-amino-6-(5-phosphoribosylamino)uracil reductase RibD [bacterium]
MHTKYMKKVLQLAQKGIGKVSPNPLVGAVVVKNNQILAEGYHAFFGGPHAEADALQRLSPFKAQNAVLYVNLEPCVHHGKTPPCVDEIIEYGISKVVIGMEDPNPLVKGNGIKKLQSSGVEVELGVMEKQCRELNEAYIKSITQKSPFVTLKIAQTLDGKIARETGESKWITSEKARKTVHAMRKAADCIMVGVNTVIQDNCRLTVRLVRGEGGKRIILDSRLRIPIDSYAINDEYKNNTIIVTTKSVPENKINLLKQKGITHWVVDKNEDGMIDIDKLLQKIYDHNMISVLVEGGKKVFTSFLKQNSVDKMVIFIAPRIFGSGIESFGRLENSLSPDRFTRLQWQKRGEEMIFKGWL